MAKIIEREAVNDEAAGSSRLYTLQPIPTKGYGLVATTRIPKGTRILSEAPLFIVPRGISDMQTVERIVMEQLRRLNKDQQRAFFALRNSHGSSLKPPVGIVRTNALALGTDASRGGLFLEAARINHSCRNNAQNTWNAELGRLTIHAGRDIEAGQEITITYADPLADCAERRRFLQDHFFFTCECEICLLPPAERAESDKRRRRLGQLDAAVGGLGHLMAKPLPGLQLVHEMLSLYEAEDLCDASIPRAYYDAFQIAIASGHKIRARVFATRAYVTRRVVEGDDSPDVRGNKGLIDRPEDHRLYGVFKTSVRETGPPPQSDAGAFEDWLWIKSKWSKTPPI
ncbi:hypothetical protein GGS23DRAFT_550441 [Durotheca rogersii]|uniref:uncharacterized protein n=1 Tax=Durotheca rogersii TaxID=419775 RepID=UPI00221F6536|nr:uncharacterized protein GGS23DRAFT_550441 [Durotheca rogersii]KAI5867870.1 hypothetical protein GGS23DRAFT_550441 [Durotheca rogersii]